MEVEPDIKWYSVTISNVESYGAAVADVDGDGAMEVVIGSFDNKVYCLNGVTGLVKWSHGVGGDVHRGISVADIDGDVYGECKLEVLVPNSASAESFTCLNGEDGTVLWTKRLVYDVHDICGRLKDVVYKGVLSKGGHTFIPNTRKSGVYFAVLRSHKIKKSLKIIRF